MVIKSRLEGFYLISKFTIHAMVIKARLEGFYLSPSDAMQMPLTLLLLIQALPIGLATQQALLRYRESQ